MPLVSTPVASPRSPPRRPTLWVLLGWTLASLVVFPYAFFAIVWTVLLIIDPQLRQANDWWAWWTVSQISIPGWLSLFATTLLAYQRRLEIDPPSAWLVALQYYSFRSLVVTATLGFITILVAQRKFVPLAFFSLLVLRVAWHAWRERKKANQAQRGTCF